MSAIPVVRPTFEAAPAQTQSRPLNWALVRARTTMFVCVAASAMIASTLLGNVMVEQARRDTTEANRLAVAAKRNSASLKNRLDAVTGYEAVSDWANANGFVAPTALVSTSSTIQ